MLGLTCVPTLCVSGLSDELVRAFALADNKFSERAGWDRETLAEELGELSILLPSINLDISITGFETGEIDILLSDMGEEKLDPTDQLPPSAGPAVTRRGDLWILRQHRILCGDRARKALDYSRLLNGQCAAMAFVDPTYNVRVPGHVQGCGRVKHPESAIASGEMGDAEFRVFLKTCLGHLACASSERRRAFCLHGLATYRPSDERRTQNLRRDTQYLCLG